MAPLREIGIFGPKPSQAAQPTPALIPTLTLALALTLTLTLTLPLTLTPNPDPSRRVIAPRAGLSGCSSQRRRAARSTWGRGGAA